MFFNSWESIGRTLLIGVLAYISLVVMLRFGGKRTLTQMNAFDLVVSVAIGSTLATILLNHSITLADGLSAYLVLIGMQFLVSWMTSRFRPFEKLVKSAPTLLYYNDHFLPDAMKKGRMSPDEVWQIARNQGLDSMGKIHAVVLEPNGSLSIISKPDGDSDESTLRNVKNYES
ncbi:DUF421 domain-containing protein [Saccharibacillus kuerlensis]|uniref:DUF421 domain-containing protein n=1 Tax=Saccharibacillus kuerlensis TaxID=459527 RepID=A0ABQ2KTE9_9BACL|nr:YetF domain-containing protein [Saccharibacillus kuerlensis]GGN92615.1 DUF421 domain-containing protein [Saccharibacillus kuerlensis]